MIHAVASRARDVLAVCIRTGPSFSALPLGWTSIKKIAAFFMRFWTKAHAPLNASCGAQ
jgi:hypothetical protein